MDESLAVAKKYDEIADRFYSLRTEKALLNEIIEMPATLSLLKDIKGKRVLDLGCGPGIYAKILKRRGAIVHGIDISSKEIEIARRHAKGVDFRVGSVYKLPYKQHSFDFVVAALVIEHFGDTDKAFKEIRRMLKKDGVFVFSIINPVIGASHSQKGKPKNYRRFDDYFKEGAGVSNWWKGTKYEVHMPAYRRTYQSWIRTVLRNGFTIDDYVDAKLTRGVKRAPLSLYKAYRHRAKIPYIAVFRVRAV